MAAVRKSNHPRPKPWFVDYRDPRTKVRVQQPTFATRKEAHAYLIDVVEPLLRRLRGAGPVVDPDTTVEALATKYLNRVEGGVKRRTTQGYADATRLYIVPKLGPRPVAHVTRDEVIDFIVECRREGVGGKKLAQGSVYAIYAALRAMFYTAIDLKLRTDNPAARLGAKLHLHPTKNQRAAAIKARALDREQLQRALEYTRVKRARWYPMVLTFGRAGLRLGECQMVQIENYNPTARTLLIEANWNDKQHCVETPKHGARIVDVARDLAVILDAHIAGLKKIVTLAGKPVSGFLFPATGGGMLEARNIRRTFKKIALGSGLGRVLKPHDLRHTFGSQLIAAGATPAYVQRQMGHASIAITVDLYGSGLPMEDRHLVDLLSPTLSPTSAPMKHVRRAGGGQMGDKRRAGQGGDDASG